MTDVVLTWLLNAVPDPQRDAHIGNDPNVLAVLAHSVVTKGHRFVVLTDCLPPGDNGLMEFHRVPAGPDVGWDNPYWYRWHLVAEYLDSHPDVTRAWACDGTDVEMLNSPFEHMAPDTLYCGSEPYPVWGPALSWLEETGRSQRKWYEEHADQPCLNVGLIGGDAHVVRNITRALADARELGDRLEMGVFQRLVFEMYPDRITGPMVHTMFRAEERTSAWWKHK
jgi:hypothetical protein